MEGRKDGFEKGRRVAWEAIDACEMEGCVQLEGRDSGGGIDLDPFCHPVVHVRRLHFADVSAHLPVDGTASDADEDAQVDASPAGSWTG